MYQIDNKKLADAPAVLGGSAVVPLGGVRLGSADVARQIGRDDEGREPWVAVAPTTAMAKMVALEAICRQRKAASPPKTGLQPRAIDPKRQVAVQEQIEHLTDAETAVVEVPLSEEGAVPDMAAIKASCHEKDLGSALYCHLGQAHASTFVDITTITAPASMGSPVAERVFIVGFDPKLEEIVGDLLTDQRDVLLGENQLTAVEADSYMWLAEWFEEFGGPLRLQGYRPEIGVTLDLDRTDPAGRRIPWRAYQEALEAELHVTGEGVELDQDTIRFVIPLESLARRAVEPLLTALVKLGQWASILRFLIWAKRYDEQRQALPPAP